MAERAEFETRLLEVTPNAPITPTLVGINVVVFLIAVAMGGGVLAPNLDVMVRLGSDYTPLTLGGQWWRLFTSTFLHFGLIHLAFNMWALYVNGLVAERIFGSSRFLLIYVVSGLAGSLCSLLWHPIVNGAGASGAIFGVLGALLGFFLRRDGGVPASVIKAQRASAAIFIVYSLLNGARVRGIDNAAHLGGLLAGLALGLLLARPLEASRSERAWTAQWVQAWGVVMAVGALSGYLILTGRLQPRTQLDEHGHPIPLAALGDPIRSFGGIHLGQTSQDLVLAKGEPVRRTSDRDWIYNSLDAKHDGLLDVFFVVSDEHSPATVFGVMFTGAVDAAPAELPVLLGLRQADLIAKYGAPISSSTGDRGVLVLQFRTGIIVNVWNDHVVSYGIIGGGR